MPEYSIAAYTIRVRPRSASRAEHSYLPLGNFDGKGEDLLVFLHGFCKALISNQFRHISEDKYLVGVSATPEDRIVFATIKSGSHGYVSTLRDVKTHQDTYQRAYNEAELISFRNCFIVPSGLTVGIFMTERAGIQGLKSSLDVALTQTFSLQYKGYTVELNPLAPEEAVKRSLEEGDLKKIRLVRYGIPQDLADQFELGQNMEDLGEMEVVLKPRRMLSMRKKRLFDALESGELSGLLEMHGIDFKDVKLEVKVGKSLRTLTITNQRPPRVTFPIPEPTKAPGERPDDNLVRTAMLDVAKILSPDLAITESSYTKTGFKWTEGKHSRLVKLPVRS